MSESFTPRTDGGARPAPRRQGINCNEAGELIPAFALGPIEPAERLLLLAHCENCPVCADTLKQMQAVTGFLPYSASPATPSGSAKTALFARIELDHATAPLPVQSAVVESPLDKHGSARNRDANRADRDRPLWFNNQFARYAAAPIALALVLVGLYTFQPFDGNNGASETAPAPEATLVSSAAGSAPTATLKQASVPSVASKSESALDNSTLDDMMIDTPVTTEGFVTQFMSATPLYTLSARTNGSATESARSIAPNDGICRMSSLKPGQYQLSLNGVDLPGGPGEAGVYLTSKSGERTLITSIKIDQSGNGYAAFNLDQPMSNYVALLIGPIEAGSPGARAVNEIATFSLSSSDQFSTIGSIAST